ncbi:MAG: biopolymer transporter ExbB [Marinosulfonomonas sp.]|nr:biopolymer transporter ExbB [Marinosulfonomonas sp.]
MDKPDREAEPFFTQPFRQGAIMVICLALVGFGAYVAYPQVAPMFLANPFLNGFILFVFVIGVLACFWQVLQLVNSVGWIEGFAGDRPGHAMIKAPRLLAPLAALLRTRGARMQIGSSSARSILDSVATRIDEARDITRYIVNLLIFLGLLGTFYGLATTVPAVVDTIRSLAPQEGEDSVEIFSRLMTGLEAQLGGMGIAFASSLLGLAGSLVVGLLELFASHGQNRFYRELEEWLSTITRLGFSSGDGDGDSDGAGDGGAAAMASHFSAQMDALQDLFVQSDVSRSIVDERLGKLADAVDALVQRMQPGSDTAVLERIALGQEQMLAVMTESGEESGGAHVDAESRMRLRSIDVQLLRILEEMAAGRQESLADLRSDLSAVNKSVRALISEVADGDGARG